MNELEYAGFWVRVGAALIDSLLILMIVLPLLHAIYGADYWLSQSFIVGTWDVLISYILPAVAVILFWVYKSATPGKIALHLKIVDAKTGQAPSAVQLIGRYFGYYVSMFPLFLGLIWVAFDKHKRGWQDLLAGTVVVREQRNTPVTFVQPQHKD